MKVLRNASFYLLSDVLNKAIPFLLLPILTAYLSPESYGSLSLFSVFLAFSTPLIQLSLFTNISRSYFKLNRKELGELIFNLQFIGFVATLIAIVIGWIFQEELSQFLDIPPFFYWFIPVALFAHSQFGYLLMIFRFDERLMNYGVSTFIITVLNVAISLLLIISLKMDWIGRAYGILVSMLAVGVVSFAFLIRLRYVQFSINWKLVKQCLWVSLPLVPAGISGSVIDLSDRVFIEELVNREELGIYSVGYSLGVIMGFFTIAVKNAVFPWMFKQLQTATDGNLFSRQIKLVRFTYLTFLFLLLTAIAITIFCHILINIGFLPPEYESAKDYIFWVCLAYVCQGTMFMLMPYMAHTGKTTYYFPLSVIAAIINLLGNYYLITMYGAIGAAYSTIIAYFSLLIGTLIYAQQVFPMPWFSKQVWAFTYHDIITIFEED